MRQHIVAAMVVAERAMTIENYTDLFIVILHLLWYIVIDGELGS